MRPLRPSRLAKESGPFLYPFDQDAHGDPHASSSAPGPGRTPGGRGGGAARRLGPAGRKPGRGPAKSAAAAAAAALAPPVLVPHGALGLDVHVAASHVLLSAPVPVPAPGLSSAPGGGGGYFMSSFSGPGLLGEEGEGHLEGAMFGTAVPGLPGHSGGPSTLLRDLLGGAGGSTDDLLRLAQGSNASTDTGTTPHLVLPRERRGGQGGRAGLLGLSELGSFPSLSMLVENAHGGGGMAEDAANGRMAETGDYGAVRIYNKMQKKEREKERK